MFCIHSANHVLNQSPVYKIFFMGHLLIRAGPWITYVDLPFQQNQIPISNTFPQISEGFTLANILIFHVVPPQWWNMCLKLPVTRQRVVIAKCQRNNREWIFHLNPPWSQTRPTKIDYVSWCILYMIKINRMPTIPEPSDNHDVRPNAMTSILCAVLLNDQVCAWRGLVTINVINIRQGYWTGTVWLPHHQWSNPE